VFSCVCYVAHADFLSSLSVLRFVVYDSGCIPANYFVMSR